MCGITGLILEEHHDRAAGWLTDMTQLLYHRGPDDGGAVVFGHNGTPAVARTFGPPGDPVDWGHVRFELGLGARRLAVLDLSPAGRQPMPAPDKHAWIVFNGEIYNHNALRDELTGRGMTFQGGSDTEVFLAAYRVWGTDCFARLEGMWAAAIVDWAAGRVVLSRDRFGIKPLCLTRFDAGIAFASEIKSLLLLPGASRGVNEARLRDFLSEGLSDHTDDTLFEGIWSIPAGCWVAIDLRTRTAMHSAGEAKRIWQPGHEWNSESDPIDKVRDAVRQAVACHLGSDVPVGSCLSGGLDSSAIVSFVRQLADESGDKAPNWSQHTFTASLPDSPLDETEYAQAVLDAFPNLIGHFVEPTADRLLDDLESLMWHQEQPFSTPSIFMQWEVMRSASQQGVTVLLDGQGGDEIFCGYQGHWPPYLAHLLSRARLPAFVREFRAASTHWFRRVPLAARVAAQLLPDKLRVRLRRAVNSQRQGWLAADLFDVREEPGLFPALRLAPPESPVAAWRDPAFARFLSRTLLSNSLPSLLRFEDRSSMAFSIEARVPFLDRPLVELAMALPPEQKLNNGRMKVILRRAVQGVVPDAVVERTDKIGFSAPTAEWMRGPLRPWWRDLISSQKFRERGCFNPSGTEKLAAAVEKGNDARAEDLWRVAIVEQWARQFLDTPASTT